MRSIISFILSSKLTMLASLVLISFLSFVILYNPGVSASSTPITVTPPSSNNDGNSTIETIKITMKGKEVIVPVKYLKTADGQNEPVIEVKHSSAGPMRTCTRYDAVIENCIQIRTLGEDGVLSGELKPGEDRKLQKNEPGYLPIKYIGVKADQAAKDKFKQFLQESHSMIALNHKHHRKAKALDSNSLSEEVDKKNNDANPNENASTNKENNSNNLSSIPNNPTVTAKNEAGKLSKIYTAIDNFGNSIPKEYVFLILIATLIATPLAFVYQQRAKQELKVTMDEINKKDAEKTANIKKMSESLERLMTEQAKRSKEKIEELKRQTNANNVIVNEEGQKNNLTALQYTTITTAGENPRNTGELEKIQGSDNTIKNTSDKKSPYNPGDTMTNLIEPKDTIAKVEEPQSDQTDLTERREGDHKMVS